MTQPTPSPGPSGDGDAMTRRQYQDRADTIAAIANELRQQAGQCERNTPAGRREREWCYSAITALDSAVGDLTDLAERATDE